ncbi:MarR family transcriptional regulator [Modestobacter sp. VKM Ac-2983]|uniref:MarR family winged helix-turn-helix transcriptional regulator n=1 Tax=Modestobacter sp. VKM Ac-2983 TaxID=3004137 RepID=UPI0022ABC1AA|nr:MarR family transcriptional regulator [Modestobacter sp. VKM Ac-2983]MCZ2806180.1 MarR family transcriptional regulator [Modestobacter sp. VKM Ac-2983]
MTDLAPHPDQQAVLGDELARLMRVMHALKSLATDESGPDARERAAHVLLFPLTRLGPLRQGALAEVVHADPSTVSRHVTLLVDQGLVRRVADERDGRASRLIVTPAGEAAMERLREERNAHLATATAGWTPAELGSFTAALQRFVQDLTDHLPTPGAPAGSAGDDSEQKKKDR